MAGALSNGVAIGGNVARLTGYIRAFGDVSFKYELGEKKEKDLPLGEDQKSGIKWEDIQSILEEHNKRDLAADLRKFRNQVLDMVGSDANKDHIDETCLDLVQMFAGQKNVTMEQFRDLKRRNGNITQSSLEKIHRVVKDLTVDMSEDTKNKIKGSEGSSDEDMFFGSSIKFTEPTPGFEDVDLSYLQDFIQPEFSLQKELTFNLDFVTAQQEALNKASAGDSIDTGWLENTIRNCYGDEQPVGMSVQEFCLTILDMLSSKRSAEELQTELFDLCGFERFEMITSLLEHRDDLAKSLKDSRAIMKKEIATAAASLPEHVDAVTRGPPVFGCQVTVQSEDERLLKKQMRKEEKKINKLLSQAVDDEEEEFHFDPVDLRMKRQAALANAMTTPLFKERERVREMTPTVEQFPYVFDNMSKAKATTGFIASTKMSLPAGFERQDNKKYEEVTMPVVAQEPVNVKKLVQISSLDEVGQMAFGGIKSLNRMQSVVYDSAYRTNENLLVCAPTGAGKTNVAMLCIAQTIKNHMDKGVLKKAEFKIVYVAPMKALAAEMAAGFGKRLEPFGVAVRELTGDMQLTKTEIANTQVLVTTPEKWDVVTRKPGDVGLAALVRLIIIDEVHLLHGDRGPVVEALVARTLRLVESSQTVIRVVGLSATLPNYIDVATFLRVNPWKGLFFFDGRFRPVPLAQTFIGVKQVNQMKQRADMDEICYNKALEFCRAGHQVMVFVHARNATVNTAMVLKEMAQQNGDTGVFEPQDSVHFGQAKNAMQRSRNRQLQELFPAGFGCHHAGMLRSDRTMVEKLFSQGLIRVLVTGYQKDRTMVEKLFSQGLIRVLVCTATLAWGVNLPAHAVIIKGTEIYNAKHGSFVDLGILDVLQIFGRAGRPQFDKSGHGIIITPHHKLAHYLSLLTNQFPIESNFVQCMTDNLNAEISLGTVTNMEEAVEWLSYSYLFVRMRKNPQVYGIKYQELKNDPTLEQKRREIVTDADKRLDKARMIRFDERNGIMSATDLGRTASHFYIKYDTVEMSNEQMKNFMNESDILEMVSMALEFEQLKVRDDEILEARVRRTKSLHSLC